MLAFFKSPPYKVIDKIWKDDYQALKGLATEALMAIKRNEVPIVLSFFDESKERMIAFFASQGVPYFNLKPETADDFTGNGKMVLCANIFQYKYTFKPSFLSKVKPCFLLESHYPIIAPEDDVLNKLQALTGVKQFTFCLSLDDPLFKVFGGENLKSMLDKLGYKEEECIESRLVSKSILRAREKIAESIKLEIKATSEAEWYAKNIRKS